MSVDPAVAAATDISFSVQVPNISVEGDTRNAWPFNLPGGGGPVPSSMRYQQIYESSAFTRLGSIDKISFRRDVDAAPFATSGIDVRIDLAYTPKSAAAPSDRFSENVGAGRVTVFDGLLDLSSSGTGVPRPFDIVIDVADLFFYDPAMGNLLLDVRARNSISTAMFDASTASQQTVTNRIYSVSFIDGRGVNATRGLIGNPTLGLVTLFGFVVPEPVSLAQAVALLFPLLVRQGFRARG